MKLADLTPTNVVAIVGLAAAAGVAFYVWKKGGLGKAAVGAAGAVVDAGGELVAGAVGEIGATVGLPTPSQTTTDAAVARWIIDHPYGGYLEASKWAGAPALMKATFMDSGSGTPPPAGSELLERFPVIPQASYDEGERLARRYPSPVDEPAPQYDPMGNYTGSW